MRSWRFILHFGIVLSLLALFPLARAEDISDFKFCLDPGHGGSDPGAIGPTGLEEADINLETALYLRDLLEAVGCTVYMTRETDECVDLPDRSGLANLKAVHRCISIHHDGNENTTINHTKVIVWTDKPTIDIDMASKIVTELDETLEIGMATSDCGADGVVTYNKHMVRVPIMPCCLPEISFISNHGEESRLRNSTYLYANAAAIFNGLVEHLAEDDSLQGCLGNCGERTWSCVKLCYSPDRVASASSSWPGPKGCTETAGGTVCHPEGVLGRMGGFAAYWGNFDTEAWEYEVWESEGDEESYERIDRRYPGPAFSRMFRGSVSDSCKYFYQVASVDTFMRESTPLPGVGSIVGVGQCNLAGEAICTALDTTNSVLFIGEKGGILEVVDAIDPDNPEVIATYDLGDYGLWYNGFDDPCALEFDGHLWAICGNNGLAVLQLHHGYTMMDVVAQWGTPGRDVALSGDYAYYTTNDLELEVLELTYDAGQQEYHLVKCGEYDFICPQGFEVFDSYVLKSGGTEYLYVMVDSLGELGGSPCPWSRLQVVDISEPCSPSLINSCSYVAGSGATRIQIHARAGDLLFAAPNTLVSYDSRSIVIDTSDPTLPEVVANWENSLFDNREPHCRQQIAADDDRVYAIGYANVHYPSPSRYGLYARWGGLECYTMCNGNVQMFSAAATDTGFDAAGDTSLVATTIIAADNAIYVTYKCAPDTDSVQDAPFNRLKVYIDHYEHGDFASVWERETDEPSGLSFSVAGPNPFTMNCSVRMTIPHKGKVELAVWDVRGRQVRSLARGYLEPGDYEIIWDGRDSDGLRVASGMYFIRLESASLAATRKVVLLR